MSHSSSNVKKEPRQVTIDELLAMQSSKVAGCQDPALPSNGTDALTDQQFERDLAEAIQLSIKEEEEYSYIPSDMETKESTSTLVEHMLHQCPVCDSSMSLSAQAFMLHVNDCLDAPSAKELKEETVTVKLETTSPCSSPRNTECSPKSEETSGTNTPVPITPAKKPKTRNIRRRPCPSYKWMQDTPYTVDAFCYGPLDGCAGYFLSHFHSDHYQGLSSTWTAGPIYCSTITANLVSHKLKVLPDFIRPLPMDTLTPIDDNVSVGLIDANHCPGSVLFVFKIRLPDGNIIHHLHTGDFRANPRMCLHPLIRQPDNPPITNLYLDTTYLNPKYAFPAQEECIKAVCSIANQCLGIEDVNRPTTMLDHWIQKLPKPMSLFSAADSDDMDSSPPKPMHKKRVLFVVGTYTIGKEKVFYHVAKMLNSKLYVTDVKRQILLCQNNPELEEMLTDDQLEAQVHVVPLMHIKQENMSAYLKSLDTHFSSLVAFKPTGWSFRPSPSHVTDMSLASLATITAAPLDRTLSLQPQFTSSTIKIYGVPYSEHSSYRELAAFIASLDIETIISTVPASSEAGQRAMQDTFERWQEEKKQSPTSMVPYPSESHW